MTMKKDYCLINNIVVFWNPSSKLSPTFYFIWIDSPSLHFFFLIDFSLERWFIKTGYEDKLSLTGYALTDLLEDLGIAKYYENIQCNRFASNYFPFDNSGWNISKLLLSNDTFIHFRKELHHFVNVQNPYTFLFFKWPHNLRNIYISF